MSDFSGTRLLLIGKEKSKGEEMRRRVSIEPWLPVEDANGCWLVTDENDKVRGTANTEYEALRKAVKLVESGAVSVARVYYVGGRGYIVEVRERVDEHESLLKFLRSRGWDILQEEGDVVEASYSVDLGGVLEELRLIAWFEDVGGDVVMKAIRFAGGDRQLYMQGQALPSLGEVFKFLDDVVAEVVR